MRMSRIVLLLVALLAGGLAAFLATRGGNAPAPGPVAPEIVQEARTQVLVATKPIGVGERLSGTNMAWQDWPKGALQADYIDKAASPEALTDMQGTVTRFEIFEGDPIRQKKLIRTDQGYLSAVLDQGMRGVSISVAAEAASGGFIVPNDHVDVVLTRNTSEGQTSETIVANVRVLAINTRLGEVGGSGAPANPENPRAEVFANSAIATLELNPAQAETVINAVSMGKLSLALRSIVDFAKRAEEPEQRNGPIKIIRYGQQANVRTGTVATSPVGDVTVDPVAYAPQLDSPTVTTAPMRGPIAAESPVLE